MEEVQAPNEVCINAKTSRAIEFHLKHNEKKDNLPIKQIVLEAYHDCLHIFNEIKANHSPGSHSWDHKIELKEGFELKSILLNSLANIFHNAKNKKNIVRLLHL